MKALTPASSWLVEPPVKGIWALAGIIIAVALPTAIRWSLDGTVMGCQMIPYVPFVILASVLLGWRHAAVVGLAGAVIADLVFMGPHRHALLDSTCDIFGITGLLVSSALIIGFVEATRRLLRDFIKEHSGGVVFSVKDGQAWASWYGHSSAVHLGPQDKVAEMMQDYLRQTQLAESWKDGPPTFKR